MRPALPGCPGAEAYGTFLRGYTDLWLATGCRKESDTPSARKPTPEITLIVDAVVTVKKVVAVALRDGYAHAIVPGYPPRYTLLRPLRAAGRPAGKRFSRDDAFALAAAQEMFVAMLMSDWRLQIARCVGTGCGVYFRLGKWNQTYPHGTRCPTCRLTYRYPAIQQRVEANRTLGRQALYDLVATRFARRIVPGTLWFRDAALKKEIVGAVNGYIRREPLLRSLYPVGLTSKWVEAGRKDKKNWRMMEKAVLRKKAGEARPGA
jgi:hypothetical protein